MACCARFRQNRRALTCSTVAALPRERGPGDSELLFGADAPSNNSSPSRWEFRRQCPTDTTSATLGCILTRRIWNSAAPEVDVHCHPPADILVHSLEEAAFGFFQLHWAA